MARNQFGSICDVCGYYGYNNEFYRLILPTYQSNMNNSLQHQDYCLKCYKDLKKLLNDFYIKEHSKETTYNAE